MQTCYCNTAKCRGSLGGEKVNVADITGKRTEEVCAAGVYTCHLKLIVFTLCFLKVQDQCTRYKRILENYKIRNLMIE